VNGNKTGGLLLIKHQKREKIEVKKRDEGETQGKITPFYKDPGRAIGRRV
jgi:hypothetical protein